MKTDGKYKSILGIAAEIDRNEQPYVVITDNNVNTTAEVCAHNDAQIVAMCQTMLTLIGEKTIPPGVEVSDVVRGGLQTEEMHLMLGASTVVGNMLASCSPEFKNKFAQVVTGMIKAFVIENKTVEQLNAESLARGKYNGKLH